jgi:transcriptional regulator with XRE-family HTH domain
VFEKYFTQPSATPMNKPQWTHEHGVLLERLRTGAGMDRATLARRNMLSMLQVEQLEKGGDSGFYNPEIKFSTGKKLLQFLGHTLKVEVAVEVADTVSNTPPVPTEAPAAPPVIQNQVRRFSGLGGALLVMVILVALFFLVQQSSTPASKVSTEAANKAAPPEPIKNVVAADNQPVPIAPAPEKKEAPETPQASVAPQTVNATCAWQTTDTEIEPTAARKKGEYVHVVALENVTICVMDGNQRVASLSLTPGQERSIYGPGPFKVYSTQLALVKVYFQGQYIKLPDPELRQVTLKPVALP